MGAGVCDDDVNQICQKASVNPAKNRGIWSIGAVGRCLSRQLAENKKLTPGCQTLVAVAAPKVSLLPSPLCPTPPLILDLFGLLKAVQGA